MPPKVPIRQAWTAKERDDIRSQCLLHPGQSHQDIKQWFNEKYAPKIINSFRQLPSLIQSCSSVPREDAAPPTSPSASAHSAAPTAAPPPRRILPESHPKAQPPADGRSERRRSGRPEQQVHEQIEAGPLQCRAGAPKRHARQEGRGR
ncbi:hypothetical protein EV426DRAFT_704925 [Tirmania nivea]|nr:hypothetical protein EV426DRAFT_704925 [Tirmania nivea]